MRLRSCPSAQNTDPGYPVESFTTHYTEKGISLILPACKTKTMNPPKTLQGIDTVIIRVSDINRSKQWYVKKLGLSVIWDDPAMKLVVLDTGSPVSLTLWQTEKRILVDKETASYPIFRTPDADAARQELHEKGVEVSEVIRDSVVNYILFCDPDGNILEACQVHEA
jgi:catechol 2,3-dioxygenase-like lactoylglutathione lyase family enzyme